MHLAQSKVVKLKTQLWSDVGIGILLVRQVDIQTDGFCADVEGSTVCGFHDPRATAGHDRELRSRPIAFTAAADQSSELARDLIVTALCQNPLGHSELAELDGIMG